MIRHRSRRRNKQRKIIIISMCSLLLIMTVGYAAMQTNLEIKAKGNIVKRATGAEALIDNTQIVTSGDGLYLDGYEDNVYTYKGAKPNNYITFNGETWRIISVNISDNTIKIIRNEVLEKRSFSTTSSCSVVYNDVRKENRTYVVNNIIYFAGEVGTSMGCNNWPEPVSLNTYLNSTYYENTLSELARLMLKGNAAYKIGKINYRNSELTTDIEEASVNIWEGPIALIDVTEYIRASTDSGCTNLYNGSYYNKDYPCKNNNWMYLNDYWWTITPDFVTSNGIWIVSSSGYLITDNTWSISNVRPVVTLSPEVQITGGDGSESSPYQLSL